MKITVSGIGYVGASLSVLLSQKNNVIAYDIDKKKVDLLNKKVSPINDNLIKKYINKNSLKLISTNDEKKAFERCDYIIISTPTNFSERKNKLDISSIEKVIRLIIKFKKNNPKIIIKSTIPIGCTDKLRKKYAYKFIYFSPEFLREGFALHDNLYPSRIIVGDKGKVGRDISNLLLSCTKRKNKIPIILTNSKEAESIKLFSNSFLAMRVSFFNELDNFSISNKLSSKDIIDGVSGDKRIGNYYNNPSFGYGGYCLPKDTKQLANSFRKTPNNLINAITRSNKERKKFLVNNILKKKPKSIGIFRLVMKSGSDNFRESSIGDIMKLLKRKDNIIYLYEPLLKSIKKSDQIILVKNLKLFIKKSEIIIANRLSKDLYHIRDKVYSRDIFQEN